MLEKLFMLIGHAKLFQSKRGPPLFTLHFRWDISAAALTFDGLVPQLKTFDPFCGYPNKDAVNVPTFPTTSPELL